MIETVLDSIDQIDQTILESDMMATYALLRMHEKLNVVLEYAEEKEEFMELQVIQEGEIFDKAKGSSLENIFKRVLLFIPRLVIAIGEAIGKCFSKDKGDKFDKDIDYLMEHIDELSPEQKQYLQSQISKQSEGKFTFNALTNSFDFQSMNPLEAIGFLWSVKTLFDKMEKASFLSIESYKPFVEEMKELLSGEKKIDSETKNVSWSTLKKCMKDGMKLSVAIKASAKVISKALDKVQSENPNNQELLNHAKALVQQLNQVSGKVVVITTGFNIVSGSVDFFRQIFGKRYDSAEEKKAAKEAATELRDKEIEAKEQKIANKQRQNAINRDNKVASKSIAADAKLLLGKLEEYCLQGVQSNSRSNDTEITNTKNELLNLVNNNESEFFLLTHRPIGGVNESNLLTSLIKSKNCGSEAKRANDAEKKYNNITS